MKNINDYLDKSLFLTEGLFGFGGKKQIEFAEQLCGAIRGVNLIWMNNIKKNISTYYDENIGPIGLGAAFVEGDKLICSGGVYDEGDYDLSGSSNLRIIMKLGDNQYSAAFDGVQDHEDKIDSKGQHSTLVRVVNTLDKNVIPAVFDPLLKWAKENGFRTKADKIYQMTLQLIDALKKKPESLLEFGQDKVSNPKHCNPNLKYVEKINDKLLKSVK